MSDYKCEMKGCSETNPHGHGTDPAAKVSVDQPYCAHRTASLIYAEPNGRWKCDGCDLTLAAVFESFSDAMRPEVFETALDAIAGTMSAVLFDYTERMQERYGIAPDDVRSDDKPYDCEADGHVRDHDGICQHCGNNPFLGADEL